MIKSIILIFVIIASNKSYAKSKCELEWNALKAVQAQLKQKSYEWLRKKEHEKHNEYQNCRKGKTNKLITDLKKEKISPKKNKQIKKYMPKTEYSRNNNKYSGEIKGKFKGEKQDAWIKYYNKYRPIKCKTPKSIQIFSQCVKHKNNEAKNFNLVWATKDL